MNYRKFGRLGWKVSEIGHGMWGIGGWTGRAGGWTGANDKESLKALHRSVELGVNFFDTAWVYGEGHSEKILKKLIKAYPNKRLYVATKIPPKNFKWPASSTDSLDEVFPTNHIVEYVEKSLKNLGLERLDLVQFHVWSDAWANQKSWQEAVQSLKRRGLIEALGISVNRREPENVLKALKTELVDSIQVVYNIFDQAPEDKLFPFCRRQRIAVIARVPFDEGSLTGTLTKDTKWPDGDFRGRYFDKDNLERTLARIEKLTKILPKGTTLSEVALRFILSSSDVTTTIPGMRQVKNVEANVAAGVKGKLDTAFIKKLRGFRWDRKPTLTTKWK